MEIPTCALDEDGVRAQGARYRRLAGHVAHAQRLPEALVIDFRAGFDRADLDEALAIERKCCPFFVLEFDAETRRLRAGVREREQLPALDALAHALTVSAS